MGATKSHINPTCWAVTGTYQGVKYDGVNVTPLLEKQKIVFSITTENGELKSIEEVFFPVHEQTEQRYNQIIQQVVGHRLNVLL